jgi:class 3 adenylate cyclase
MNDTAKVPRRQAVEAVAAIASTRRLAAILAADIVGCSRLMGLDEAGTVEALREHRVAADPLIAQYGGRVVKTTGDGLLIEFGSVVGAVNAPRGCNGWRESGMRGPPQLTPGGRRSPSATWPR